MGVRNHREKVGAGLWTRLSAGIVFSLAVCLWPRSWRWLLPALSPWVAVCSAVALRSVSLATLAALPMLVLMVFRRRFLCHRLCPVGLLSDYCGKVRLRRLRQHRTTRARLAWPPGRFLVFATLGGALLGYPLFLWMDPLALFSGAFGFSRMTDTVAAALALAGLPIVAAISVLFPGAWCGRICPLGAAQDLLALAPRWFRKDKKWALVPARRAFLTLGAGTAVSVLLPRALAAGPRPLRPPGSVDEVTFTGACLRCGSCVRVCPTRIIEPSLSPRNPARFLAPALRFSGANYCLQDCNRCGAVCPSGVIRRLPLTEKNRHVIGIATIDLSHCRLTDEMECGVCIPRCPRSAIVEVFDYRTYTAAVKVVSEKCNGCGACVGVCPPRVVRVEAQCDNVTRFLSWGGVNPASRILSPTGE